MKTVELKQIIAKNLEATSIHAIPNIVRTNSLIAKLIWILCLLGSSGYCSYEIYKSIASFYDYEVVTTTRKIDKNELNLPVITICNLNMFATENAKQLLKNEIKHDFQENISSRRSFVIKRYKLIDVISRLNETEKRSLGFEINQTILNCIFKLEDCNISDFRHYFDKRLGNCFQFNSETNKKQKLSGPVFALELELILDPTFKQNENFMSQNEGFFVYIGDSDVNYLLEDGIRISPGYSTNIILEKYSHKIQEYPYSNCTNDLNRIDSYDSINYKTTINLKKSYKRKTCIEICFQHYFKDLCGCFDESSIILENQTRICLTSSDFVCILNVSQSLDTAKYCGCPYECETNGFNKFVSFSSFPTRYYKDYLLSHPDFVSKFPTVDRSNITYENFKNSIASVNIYFNEIKVIETKESIKFDQTSLVSNIGGLLGLFLGASFLSIVEILEVLIIILIKLLNSHTRKS